MQAGRDLDALIAEKVMGEPFRPYAQILTSYPSKSVPETPFYSTDIKAAWTVVENMAQNQKSFQINYSEADGEVRVHFIDQAEPGSGYHEEVGGLKYLPHATCLAALRAMGVEI